MRQKSLIVLLLLGLAVPNIANAVQFERGGVFASLSNGTYSTVTREVRQPRESPEQQSDEWADGAAEQRQSPKSCYK